MCVCIDRRNMDMLLILYLDILLHAGVDLEVATEPPWVQGRSGYG